MRSSDVGYTVLIIVLVIILISLNVLYVMKAQIEKNWVKYRCNPLVIPFAGMFGKDVMQNFTYCIQNVQQNYMSFVLAPTHFNLGNLNVIGSQMGGFSKNVVEFIDSLRSMVTGLTGNIFGVFMNIIIEFQRLIIGLKDLFGKMLGVVATMIYLIEGTIFTAQSTWNGPPGKMLRLAQHLCFSPHTLVQLTYGRQKKFKDIELGDILKDGSIVKGVLKLHNSDAKNPEKEEYYYSLPHGENNEPILVTGYHLVNYKNRYIYVKDHPLASKTVLKEPVLHCLITDTHNICIGKYTFWDWEDTPEMNREAEKYKYSKLDNNSLRVKLLRETFYKNRKVSQ